MNQRISLLQQFPILTLPPLNLKNFFVLFFRMIYTIRNKKMCYKKNSKNYVQKILINDIIKKTKVKMEDIKNGEYYFVR